MPSIIRKMNRHLPGSFRKSAIFFYVYRLAVHFDPKFKSDLEDAAEIYCSLSSESDKKRIKNDMLFEYLCRKAELDEYIRYRFYLKPAAEREAYFLDWERKHYFSSGSWNVMPRDKFQRYKMFQQLYHRDIIQIRPGEGPELNTTYQDFCKRHEHFILKPSNGVKGRGIRKVSSSEYPSVDKLLQLAGGSCILEEIIDQGDELAVFHPSSINTLRLVTAVSDKGNAECLFALFRTGCGGSVVDNVGSGGIICEVELSTGTVISDGLWKTEMIEKHPNTGIKFKGTRIPIWDDVCNLAKEAHMSRSDQRLIGWDFAWTKSGWDVVETNPSPSFQSIQYLRGQGIRPELKKLFSVI